MGRQWQLSVLPTERAASTAERHGEREAVFFSRVLQLQSQRHPPARIASFSVLGPIPGGKCARRREPHVFAFVLTAGSARTTGERGHAGRRARSPAVALAHPRPSAQQRGHAQQPALRAGDPRGKRRLHGRRR